MTLSSLALATAISLNVIYLVLALVASSHVKKEKTSPMMPALLAVTLWWPFYDIYDESIRRIRPWGIVLFVVTAGAYVAWGLTR